MSNPEDAAHYELVGAGVVDDIGNKGHVFEYVFGNVLEQVEPPCGKERVYNQCTSEIRTLVSEDGTKYVIEVHLYGSGLPEISLIITNENGQNEHPVITDRSPIDAIERKKPDGKTEIIQRIPFFTKDLNNAILVTFNRVEKKIISADFKPTTYIYSLMYPDSHNSTMDPSTNITTTQRGAPVNLIPQPQPAPAEQINALLPIIIIGSFILFLKFFSPKRIHLPSLRRGGHGHDSED